MKKILSVLLALAMVCALSVSVFAEEEIYSMTTTQGQNQEDLALPATLTMSDSFSRIATNWVGGGTEYSAIIEAINTPDASIVITYTGNITKFLIQTEKGTEDGTVELNPVVVDGKNVAVIPCSDVIAAMPFACANTDVGWGNIAFICEDGAVLESFKVVTGAVAPAGDPVPADDTTAPAEDATAPVEAPAEAPAETPAETSEPADTGIVLAVLPMAIAAAAVVISKRK